MKVILAILSVSLAYSSGFENQDALDQYIAIHHSSELNRTDLSQEFLRAEVAKTKDLVEIAKKTRLAAERLDMDEGLDLAAGPIAKQRVVNDHNNKRISQIEQDCDKHLATLDAQYNIITAGDLPTAWYAIFRVKVAADMIILQTH